MKRRAQAPISSWSRTTWRRVEALRDRILFGHGSGEPWIPEDWAKAEGETGMTFKAMHWRKPLSMIEVNRMAPTPEVRQRPGRP